MISGDPDRDCDARAHFNSTLLLSFSIVTVRITACIRQVGQNMYIEDSDFEICCENSSAQVMNKIVSFESFDRK